MQGAVEGGEGSGRMSLAVNEVLDAVAREPRLHRPGLLRAGKRLQCFEVSDHEQVCNSTVVTHQQILYCRHFIQAALDLANS